MGEGEPTIKTPGQLSLEFGKLENHLDGLSWFLHEIPAIDKERVLELEEDQENIARRLNKGELSLSEANKELKLVLANMKKLAVAFGVFKSEEDITEIRLDSYYQAWIESKKMINTEKEEAREEQGIADDAFPDPSKDSSEN
jgi:hypothetical protein